MSISEIHFRTDNTLFVVSGAAYARDDNIERVTHDEADFFSTYAAFDREPQSLIRDTQTLISALSPIVEALNDLEEEGWVRIHTEDGQHAVITPLVERDDGGAGHEFFTIVDFATAVIFGVQIIENDSQKLLKAEEYPTLDRAVYAAIEMLED